MIGQLKWQCQATIPCSATPAMHLFNFISTVSAVISFKTHQLSLDSNLSLVESCDEIQKFMREKKVDWKDAFLAGATVAERLSLAGCLRVQDPHEIKDSLEILFHQFQEGDMIQLGPYQAVRMIRDIKPDLLFKIFGFQAGNQEVGEEGEETLIGDVQKTILECNASEDPECLQKALFEVATLFMQNPIPIKNAQLNGNRLSQFLLDALAWPQQDKLTKQVRVRLEQLKPTDKKQIDRLLTEYTFKGQLIMADVAAIVYPALLKAGINV